jgi:O-antigen ligase
MSLLTVVAVVFPRSTPAVLSLMAIAGVLSLWVKGLLFSLPRLSQTTWILLACFFVWCLAGSTWAAEPWQSASKVALLAGVLFAVALLLNAVDGLDASTSSQVVEGFAFGLAIATVFLAIETTTDQWIGRTAYNLIPSLRAGYTQHLTIQNGVVVEVSDININRRVYVWAMLLLPALWWLWGKKRTSLESVSLVVLLLGGAAILATTRHQSSQLQILAAGAAFLVARLSLPLARNLLAIGFAALFLLSVPAAIMAQKAGVGEWSALPPSAQHRIAIWGHTAQRIAQSPWFGVGPDGTAALHVADAKRFQGLDVPYGQRLEIGRHAHNVFLQSWFELGAIGVTLLLALAFAAWRGISRMPEQSQIFMVALSAGLSLSLATSYSLWQPWLLALLALMAVASRGAMSSDVVHPARTGY